MKHLTACERLVTAVGVPSGHRALSAHLPTPSPGLPPCICITDEPWLQTCSADDRSSPPWAHGYAFVSTVGKHQQSVPRRGQGRCKKHAARRQDHLEFFTPDRPASHHRPLTQSCAFPSRNPSSCLRLNTTYSKDTFILRGQNIIKPPRKASWAVHRLAPVQIR